MFGLVGKTGTAVHTCILLYSYMECTYILHVYTTYLLEFLWALDPPQAVAVPGSLGKSAREKH